MSKGDNDGSPKLATQPDPEICRLLRPHEVAQMLGVSRRTIYALVQAGQLTACRIGVGAGTIRIHPDDLTAYVRHLRQAAGRQLDERPTEGSPGARPDARRRVSCEHPDRRAAFEQ
jgi:excisionase family DNA binding protein